ncbi:MAG: DUF4214 domain-containing protein [Actinomycetota bacterium]|nr:DUF4214 domain-containing protein [Actinomycetota bacterium]
MSKRMKVFAVIFSVIMLISLSIPSMVFADSGVEAFVTRFYNQCLDRAPDPDGLANWIGHLQSGYLAGADVAERFIFSEEFQAKNTSNEQFLQVMYKAFFNRPPDPEGYAGWLGQLQRGQSRRFVLAGFVNSVEFEALCAQYGIRPGSIGGGDRDDRDSGGSSGAAATPATISATGNITVVAMGDSLIVKSDWVPRLAQLLRQNYPGANFNVIASAQNGETASGGYGRFDSTVAVHNPDIIVIAYGTNDAGNGLTNYDRYLSKLTDKAKATGAIVFLQNFGPIKTNEFPTKSDYMSYVSKVQEIASERGVRLIDVHGPLNANISVNLIDWCHYSSTGSAVVANTVYSNLSSVLVK